MVKKSKSPKNDEYITNNILGIFALAFILIIGLMVTYRGFARVETIRSTISIVYGFSLFAAVLTAAGIIWEYVSAKKREDARRKLVSGRNFAIASASAAICAFVAGRFFVDGIKALYIVIPTLSVLALIYFIYSTEFFIIASMASLGGFLMWYMSRSYYELPITRVSADQFFGSGGFYASVFTAVILAAAVLIIASASRNGGGIRLSGRNITLFQVSANYPLMYASAAVTALCAAAALIFGAGIAYYLMFAAFGYLFILAVYYTVRMM